MVAKGGKLDEEGLRSCLILLLLPLLPLLHMNPGSKLYKQSRGIRDWKEEKLNATRNSFQLLPVLFVCK